MISDYAFRKKDGDIIYPFIYQCYNSPLARARATPAYAVGLDDPPNLVL